jgi:hypothetical protein
MARLPVLAAALILPDLALAQTADDAAKCQTAAGSYLVGAVVSGPRFKPGAPLHGTYLSHTHLTVRGDDGQAYDVAMDNVFANGYRHNQPSVPAPLNTIKVGDRLELCGQLYTGGSVGILLGARDQQGRQRRRQYGGQAGFLLALAELNGNGMKVRRLVAVGQASAPGRKPQSGLWCSARETLDPA